MKEHIAPSSEVMLVATLRVDPEGAGSPALTG